MVTNASARVWSDLAVPPGELLQEELDAIGMTQQELAMRTGRPVQVINEIVRDKKRITHETALEFEKVLGIPAHFWVNLEADYQLTQARLRDQEGLRRQEEWLKEFPVREMERRGWIPRCSEKIDKVRELLRFLGVASFPAWRQTMQTVLGFRMTPRANVSEGALAVWLRKGELEGRERQTAVYDEARFVDALSAARALTTEEPEVFVPRAQELCADAGVAVVFVPEFPRSGAHGVARWLTPEKALIQLSLRYKTNDHLWFSFFHEARHVLSQHLREVHIDGVNGGDEEEADRFARDTLIPPEAWMSFARAGAPSRSDVERFAAEVGIAPGIVVGRLQHERVIPWQSDLNRLKVSFRWTEDGQS
jgi:HTH-type transcriptional regulator/antitoxin HigA